MTEQKRKTGRRQGKKRLNGKKAKRFRSQAREWDTYKKRNDGDKS